MQPQKNKSTTPPPQLFVAPQTVQEAPKKRLSIVWVVLAIIAVPVFGEQLLFSRPSGLSYNGVALSQPEAQDTARDIASMTAHAKAGDPNSIDSGYEPSTAAGERFKEILADAKKINSEYLDATKDARSTDFLGAKMLGSEDGRKQAHSIHDQFVKATKKYRLDTKNYQMKLAAYVDELSGKKTNRFEQFNLEEQTIEKLDDAEIASIDNLLKLVDTKKPEYDAANGKLRFQNRDQIDMYLAIRQDIAAKEEALNAKRQEILQARQERMNNAMSGLQSYSNPN